MSARDERRINRLLKSIEEEADRHLRAAERYAMRSDKAPEPYDNYFGMVADAHRAAEGRFDSLWSEIKKRKAELEEMELMIEAQKEPRR